MVAIDNKIEQAMVSRSPPSPPGGVQGGVPVLWVGVSPGAGGPPRSPACCWAEQLLCLPAAAGRAHWLRLRRSAQGKKGGGWMGDMGRTLRGCVGDKPRPPAAGDLQPAGLPLGRGGVMDVGASGGGEMGTLGWGAPGCRG